MPNVKWVMGEMEAWAPLSLAEEYDNVGLLVGDANQPVKKVLVALDATVAVIEEAASGGFGCIITHHPLMRDPMKRVTVQDATGKKIISLIKNGISLYTAHTNLDKAIGGVNDCLAEKMGLLQTVPMAKESQNSEIGFGKVGEMPNETTLVGLAKHVKDALGLQSVRICGNASTKVKKIALCGGSGMSFLQAAKESGCDVYITGDVKYSDALVAQEYGMCIIDATHYGTENIIVQAIVERLSAKAAKDGVTLEICASKVDSQPFYSL